MKLKGKIGSIVSLVCMLLVGTLILSFSASLFSTGSGGGSSGGTVNNGNLPGTDNIEPGEPEEPPIDITPTSLDVVYTAEKKEGFIDQKLSSIYYDQTYEGHKFEYKTISDSPYIALYSDSGTHLHKLEELRPLSDSEGIIVDLEFNFNEEGSNGQSPSFCIQFCGRTPGVSLFHLSERIYFNGVYEGNDTHYITYGDRNFYAETYRLTYMLKGFMFIDGNIYGYRMLYLNGEIINEGWFLIAEGYNSLSEFGLVFADVRLSNFKDYSPSSYIFVRNYSYSTFGDIDMSGVFNSAGELTNAPKSLNDAYISAFIKDRTVINDYMQ